MPSRADSGKRALCLAAFTVAVTACDPRRIVGDSVSFSKAGLNVRGRQFKARRIFAIGMGKASGAMAEALEKAVPVEAGVVAVPQGTARRFSTKNIRLVESTHPLPCAKSAAAARAMLALAEGVRPGDLVVSLVSGGGSALAELPLQGISIKEMCGVSSLLMRAGAPVGELNAVRQCLSQIKAGGLASAFHRADLVNLVISDVVGSPLEVIASAPTVDVKPDARRAARIIRMRGIAGTPAGRKALKVISSLDLARRPMPRISSFVLADNDHAVDAAVGYLRCRGLNPLAIKRMQGEARTVGRNLASVVNSGACFVAGGETVVTVRGKGRGGRCQELALAASMRLKRGVLLAAGTDGVDGVSHAAGALVDSNTSARAEGRGLRAEEYLSRNDSNTFFRRLGGSLVVTGPTGTNACDVVVGVP
ncbi:MAG: DUF4147 domain-containing protein [Candidatus Micrarchaeota archaeon]